MSFEILLGYDTFLGWSRVRIPNGTSRVPVVVTCNGDSLVTSALAPEGVQYPYPSPLLDPNRRFTYEEDRYPTAHRRRGDIRPLRVLNSSFIVRKQAPALRSAALASTFAC